MATIQYTSYTFNEPDIINESQYSLIKEKLKLSPKYNPFPTEGFFKKFKTVLLIYLFGIPTALFIFNFGYIWGGFEVIAGIFGFLAFGMLFSFIPEAMSYIKFLLQRYNYYEQLMRCLKRSNNYHEFRNLMGFPLEDSDIQALLNIEEESLKK